MASPAAGGFGGLDVGGVAVGPFSPPGRVAQPSVSDELSIHDIAYEHGPHPSRAGGVGAGNRPGERAVVLFQGGQALCEGGAGGVGPAGADVADVDQVSGGRVVRDEQQPAERAVQAALARYW